VARIPIDDQPAASISIVTAYVVWTSIEQRQARGHHPGQFRVLGRDVRLRFEGQRVRERYVEQFGSVRHMWGEEQIGTRHILYAYVSSNYY
jgi:hypothetical protein